MIPPMILALLRKPQPRYGLSNRKPEDYGEAYAKLHVVPGDMVVIVVYGQQQGGGVVLSWDDPDVVADARSAGTDVPAFNDGYVYVRAVSTGTIDGYPPITLRKK